MCTGNEMTDKCTGCEATEEELDLLASGDVNCYELWGAPYPSCWDCKDVERNDEEEAQRW